MSGVAENKEWFFSLETGFDKILDRSQLPDDVDVLKDLFILTTQRLLEEVEDLKDKVSALSETIDYLNGQLSIFRRFQYGQRSERLKKKLK